MSPKLPDMRPINPRIRRQTVLVLVTSLILSGGLLFFAVWSSTKQMMEQGKLSVIPDKVNPTLPKP